MPQKSGNQQELEELLEVEGLLPEVEAHLDEEHREAEALSEVVLVVLLEVEGVEEVSLVDVVLREAAALAQEAVAGSSRGSLLCAMSFLKHGSGVGGNTHQKYGYGRGWEDDPSEAGNGFVIIIRVAIPPVCNLIAYSFCFNFSLTFFGFRHVTL